MKFEEYPIGSVIKKNLQSMGIKKPTDIQYKSIPHILKKEDVLAIAQTGTGKTAAFAVPLIHMIAEGKKRQRRPDGIKCLVLVPTRELAIQLSTVFREIANGTHLNILDVYGGVSQDHQIKELQLGADILIVTPGRMFDLIHQGYIRLNRVDTLVLDEADHMLDLGFIKDIRDVLRHLPAKRQTLFFSATINREIKKLAYSLVNKPIRIQVSPKNPVAKSVAHEIAFVEMDDKRYFLEYILNERPNQKVIVFVRTQVRADRVMKAMLRVDIESEALHGGVEQSKRFSIMERFKAGENKVLIATDVSARGVDIPNVDLVVNYDMPDKPENYVHRCGRTGRGGKRGEALGFCSEEEKSILNDIEFYMGTKVSILEMSRSTYRDVVSSTDDSSSSSWKSLMKEHQNSEKNKRHNPKRKGIKRK